MEYNYDKEEQLWYDDNGDSYTNAEYAALVAKAEQDL